MSEHRRARLLDWGARLFILALLTLWVIIPPKPTTSPHRHMVQEMSK